MSIDRKIQNDLRNEFAELTAELRKAGAERDAALKELDALKRNAGKDIALSECRKERDAWKAEAIAAAAEKGRMEAERDAALMTRVSQLERVRDELRNYAGAAGYPMGQIEHMGKLLKAAQDRVGQLERALESAVFIGTKGTATVWPDKALKLVIETLREALAAGKNGRTTE